MAEIRGFRGVRYNPAQVGSLADVVAPPYDVISPEQKQALLKRHVCNVIRLILGKDFTEEEIDLSRYREAAHHLRTWLDENVLQRDAAPAIYVYDQTFSVGDQTSPDAGTCRTRRALIATVRLEEFEKGIIRPHEKTLSGPKRDRLELMRTCQANLSQVFGLYPHSPAVDTAVDAAIGRTAPLISFTDDAGIRHDLRLITNGETLTQITAALAETPIFIADGHHRYETALNYRNEQRAAAVKWTGEEPANFVMMALVDMAADGLVVLPTHRVVRLDSFDSSVLWQRMKPFFNVTPAPADSDPEAGIAGGAGEHRFGLFLADTLYVLELKPDAPLSTVLDATRSAAYNNLDVTLLHAIVIEHVLKLTAEEVASGRHLFYTISAAEALDRVRNGQATMALLLNPTRVTDVEAVADAGDTMPQKSTYFYPKLISGIVMNDLSSW